MTYDEWEETYQPIRNYTDHAFESRLFETYGDDLAFIEAMPKDRVWTLVDHHRGGEIIMEGMRFVNRLGYFVTVRPWSEPVEVVLYGS